jgi:hypothetical protein
MAVRILGHCNPEGLMRVHYTIAIVAIVLIGFSLKLTLFSAPPAEANVGFRIDTLQLQQNIKSLPEQKMNDMTFVFSEGD